MLSRTTTAFIAVVVGAALTAPAIAAGSKKIRKPHSAVSHPMASQIPPPAYGFRADGRAHSPNPAWDVYVDGTYAGSDPDPHVRATLARDPPFRITR